MLKNKQESWLENWKSNLIVLKKNMKNDFERDAEQMKIAVKNMLRYNHLFNKNFKKENT